MGRPKKDKSTLATEPPLSDRQPEIESSQNYLELPDPDTHILIVESEPREDDYQLDCALIEQGKVRHWSETDVLTRPGIIPIYYLLPLNKLITLSGHVFFFYLNNNF